jgi:hypothetical protein
MTTLEELKRRAEAVTAAWAAYDEIDDQSIELNAEAKYYAAVGPRTILSLIERVERSESERDSYLEQLAIRSESAMHAEMQDLLTRQNAMLSEAYQRGMEDAAKVAEARGWAFSERHVETWQAYHHQEADDIAKAIREKAKASAVVWQNPTSWSRESTDGVLYIERMAGQKSPWKAFMAGELIGQGKTEDEAKALCEKAKAGKHGEG